MSSKFANKDEIFEKLVKTIEELLQMSREQDSRNIKDISMDTDIFDDLEIDSLEVMDMASAVEEVFEVSINVEEMATKRKISELVDYLADKLA